MIEQILAWWPIIWTARIATLIVLAALALTTFVYFARLCRPRHLIGMIAVPLPSIREVGGEVLGQKLAVKLNATQDHQLASLVAQVSELRLGEQKHRALLTFLAQQTLTEEQQHGLFD